MSLEQYKISKLGSPIKTRQLYQLSNLRLEHKIISQRVNEIWPIINDSKIIKESQLYSSKKHNGK